MAQFVGVDERVTKSFVAERVVIFFFEWTVGVDTTVLCDDKEKSLISNPCPLPMIRVRRTGLGQGNTWVDMYMLSIAILKDMLYRRNRS
jgi:hypothetical protein